MTLPLPSEQPSVTSSRSGSPVLSSEESSTPDTSRSTTPAFPNTTMLPSDTDGATATVSKSTDEEPVGSEPLDPTQETTDAAIQGIEAATSAELALPEYQIQLLLLEQQNKKRLTVNSSEEPKVEISQDNMTAESQPERDNPPSVRDGEGEEEAEEEVKEEEDEEVQEEKEEQQQQQSPPSVSAEGRYHEQRKAAKKKIYDEVEGLVGLNEVKQHFSDIESYIHLCRRQKTNPRNERYHAVFQGNPGTGKTTVARIYAKFLISMGILTSSTYRETSGAQMAFMGPEEVKGLFGSYRSNLSSNDASDWDDDFDPTSTLSDFGDNAFSLDRGCLKYGGVLFVDEAYQLTAPHVSNAGRQVLDVLLTEIENNIGRLVVIFAGYKEELELFFGHNQGLRSRVPYTIQFADFNESQLLQILVSCITKKYKGGMKVEDGLKGKYMQVAIRRLACGRGKKGFGNARAIENLLSKVCQRQARRVSCIERATDEQVFTLTKEDLLGPNPSNIRIQSQAWDKLQRLTGLHKVKETVSAMFDTLETNYRREMNGKAPLKFSLNRIFVGSPGTGKTTVAKYYGQILVDLGLLSNGDVVIKNPADFIGEAVGKSEANTKAILASTVGKVLIIDEAYMLDPGDASRRNDSFRGCVLDTIVAEVQSIPGDDRCVILLGYEEKLREMFRNANPGLPGRFDAENPFRFEDFNLVELGQMLEQKIAEQDLSTTPDGLKTAKEVLDRGRIRQNFSNGREVDILLSSAKANHGKRQSKKNAADRCYDVVLKPEDFDPNYARADKADINCRAALKDMVSDDIICQLEKYQRLVQGAKLRNMDAHELVPQTFIFKGPSGTGKTVAARYMGELFYNIGFLPTKEVVECSAADFIGEHVGHTVPKTRAQFERGLGKVLFIDEAHQLKDSGYSTEAINEIVYLLKKYSGKIVVILAGPSQGMDALMTKENEFASIFRETIAFQSLKPEDCLILLNRMLREKSVISCFLDDDADRKRFTTAFKVLSLLPHWRNAKDIRDLAESMTQDVLIELASGTQDAKDLRLSKSQANSQFNKMFLKKRALQRSDNNDRAKASHGADAAQTSNNNSTGGHKTEACSNIPAVNMATRTDMEAAVKQSDDMKYAQDERRDQFSKKSFQQALRKMGVCGGGLDWRRVTGGYQCAAGICFQSDADIEPYLR